MFLGQKSYLLSSSGLIWSVGGRKVHSMHLEYLKHLKHLEYLRQHQPIQKGEKDDYRQRSSRIHPEESPRAQGEALSKGWEEEQI
jgi:hypothetical protein